MKHFDDVKRLTIEYICDLGNREYEYYIIRDVFGKISVYIADGNEDCQKIQSGLTEMIGQEWMGKIVPVSRTDYFYKEISKCTEKIKENVYFGERPLVKKAWKGMDHNRTAAIRAKIVGFYSYKGGVGRTTTLALTALQMARRGKKIVIIDFDLEAPGLSTLLRAERDYPRYGVVDFLIECEKNSPDLDITEYIYPVTSKSLLGLNGGEVYVMQAMNMQDDLGDGYYNKISRIDFNMPQYTKEHGIVDQLLQKIDQSYNPDFIFVDARAGIHDIGGVTLLGYSDEVVLTFYGNQQNMQGLKFILPKLVDKQIPFYLLNSPAPVNEEERTEEVGVYAKTSLDILAETGYFAEDDTVPDIYDESSVHYPMSIYYDELLTNLNSDIRIVNILGNKGDIYEKLANQLQDEIHQTEHKKIELDEKKKILQVIQKIIPSETASADTEFTTNRDMEKNFYPLLEYKYIFDKTKFLITGAKGTEKTTLFNILKSSEYVKSLAKYLEMSQKEIEKTEWIVGVDETKGFPAVYNFDAIGKLNDMKCYSIYWKILLINVLKPVINKMDIKVDTLVEEVLNLKYQEMAEWICRHSDADEPLWAFLEFVDDELVKNGKNVIVIYDKLDRLLREDFRGKMVSELLNLWYVMMTRCQALHTKIFLRIDILKNEVNDLTDKIKFDNYRTTIEWNYEHMLALVWKRLIENDESLKKIILSSLEEQGYSIPYKEGVGYVPRPVKEVNEIILKLFSVAAKKELESSGMETYEGILSPKSLEKSIGDVSVNRITDMKEEYPQYINFFDNLKNFCPYFPVEEEAFCDGLKHCGFAPENFRNNIDELKDIGILKEYQRKKSDPIRYHIPDIYLKGMGLVRKGS